MHRYEQGFKYIGYAYLFWVWGLRAGFRLISQREDNIIREVENRAILLQKIVMGYSIIKIFK